jgi:hypothetical protein
VALEAKAMVESFFPPSHALAGLSFGAREIDADNPGMLKFTLDREVCLANPNYLKVLDRMKDKLTVTGAASTTF